VWHMWQGLYQARRTAISQGKVLGQLQGVTELPGQSFLSQYRYICLPVEAAIANFFVEGNTAIDLEYHTLRRPGRDPCQLPVGVKEGSCISMLCSEHDMQKSANRISTTELLTCFSVMTFTSDNCVHSHQKINDRSFNGYTAVAILTEN